MYFSWYLLFESPSCEVRYRCKYDGSVYLLSLTIISYTCFVVHPCLLAVSFFLILYTISSGIFGGLPLFGLFFNPSIPSSLYLFKPIRSPCSASVQIFCNLCRNMFTYTTFKTSNILSFVSALDSVIRLPSVFILKSYYCGKSRVFLQSIY